MGMCSVLAIWVCWDCILNLYWERQSAIGGRLAFPVFRGCGGLLLLHWYWGISVYVWTRFRINYIYLFDFDPRIVDTPLTIFEDATDETLVFFIILLLYYKVRSIHVLSFDYTLLLRFSLHTMLIDEYDRPKSTTYQLLWLRVSTPLYWCYIQLNVSSFRGAQEGRYGKLSSQSSPLHYPLQPFIIRMLVIFLQV